MTPRARGLWALLMDPRGGVAIEFAAIALPFLLLMGGTIEVSRFLWTRHALQDSASVGARCLGLGTAPCYVGGAMDRPATIAFVRQQAEAWAIRIPPDAVLPEPTVACHGLTEFARVEIRHRFTSVLPVLPDIQIEVDACFPIMRPD